MSTLVPPRWLLTIISPQTDIDGDASFNMTLTELSTAAQFNIAVKIIVLNNEEQGMVTQWQSLFYEDRFAHTHQRNPDFLKLADAMGIQGKRCIAPDDVDDSLRWLIDEEEGEGKGGPKLLEVVTDKKIPVLPMVPGGKGLHEYLVYDEGEFPFFSRFSPRFPPPPFPICSNPSLPLGFFASKTLRFCLEKIKGLGLMRLQQKRRRDEGS